MAAKRRKASRERKKRSRAGPVPGQAAAAHRFDGHEAPEAAGPDLLPVRENPLAEERLHDPQRQALAAQVGRVQGNQHLQGLVLALKQDGPAAPRRGQAPLPAPRRPGTPVLPRPLPAVGQPSLQRQAGGDKDEPSIQEQVAAAADKAARVARFLFYLQHTDWIDGLPNHLQEQIHSQFSFAEEEKAFKKSLAGDKERQKLLRDIKKRKGQEKDKSKHAAIDKELAAHDATRRAEFEAQPVKRPPEESLVEMNPQGVTWQEGRTFARVNFMASMSAALGSVDAVKTHFRAIEGFDISGSTVFLHKTAGARLRQAAAAFEKKHPAARFPATSGGQSLRGRHQERHSGGMLSHAMGFALDYHAYENPHLKDRRFLLETIGGGPAHFVLTDAGGAELGYGARRGIIQKLGKETVQNVPADQRDPKGVALLGQLKQTHAAMLKTSQAFQQALPDDSKAKLRAAAETYWSGPRAEIAGLNKQVARANKKLAVKRRQAAQAVRRRRMVEFAPRIKEARAATAQELQAQGLTGKRLRQAVDRHESVASLAAERDTITPDMIDAEPQVAALLQEKQQAQARLAEIHQGFRPVLEEIFDPFLQTIDAALAKIPGEASLADVTGQPREDYLRHLAPKVAAVPTAPGGSGTAAAKAQDKAWAALKKHLKQNQKLFGDVKPDDFQTPAQLQARMLDRLQFVRLSHLRERLLGDLNFVFGPRADKVILGGRARQVSEPSVLQLAELGFMRNDPLPQAPAPAAGKKGQRPESFGLAFFEVMVEHGFDPGAAWGNVDTMHFDFIEGFGAFAHSEGTFGPLGHK